MDCRPAENRVGSPAWASMIEVKEETFFASAFDQNIHEMLTKLKFCCLMRQKG